MKHFRTIVLLVFTAAVITSVSFASESGHRKERSKKGWIGISIQNVTPKFARENNLSIKEGVYVNIIAEESPAESAGVKEGDVITEFNGKKIEIADDLISAVNETKPGTKTTISLIRNNDKKSLSITVGKYKTARDFAFSFPHAPRALFLSQSTVEGMQLMELEKQLGEYFQVPNGKGLLVTEVEKESNSAKAGLQAGDVITKIGDEQIDDMDDVHEAFEEKEEGNKVSVEYLRKGKKSTATLEISHDSFGNMEWNMNRDENFYQFRIPEFQRELQLQIPDIQKELKRIRVKVRDGGEV